MANYINSTMDDVKFHLDNQDFEGPIDLLVRMVKEAKIDILNIFVSDITKQYVAYVQTMKELDYEYVAEYIILAATLIEIKSSKILPMDDGDPEYQEDLGRMERNLISDIEKHLLKDLPDQLKPLETLNLFYTEPVYDEKDYQLVIKDFNLEKLIGAFQMVLERIEFQVEDVKPKTIEKDRFTVADKVVELASRVRTEKKVHFYGLFEPGFSKMEIISVFLAVLEVLKKQIAMGVQDEKTKDIILTHNEAEDNFKDLENTDEELLTDVEVYD